MIGRAEDGTLAAIAVAEEDERELELERRQTSTLLAPLELEAATTTEAGGHLQPPHAPAFEDADTAPPPQAGGEKRISPWLLFGIVASMTTLGTVLTVVTKLMTIPMANYPITLTFETVFAYVPISLLYILIRWAMGTLDPASLRYPWKEVTAVASVFALGQWLLIYGTQYTSGPMQVLLSQGAIPFSMAISTVMIGSTYRRRHFAGALLVCGGILVSVGEQLARQGAERIGWFEGLWITLYTLSWAPITLYTVYSELLYKKSNKVDPIIFTGIISALQLPFLLLYAPAFTFLSRPPTPLSSLPTNIWDGCKCLVGVNTLPSDDCWPLAPVFVASNNLLNLLLLLPSFACLEYGSSNLLWLACTLMVPLSNMAFSLPGIPERTPATPGNGLALLIITVGLCVYGFSKKTALRVLGRFGLLVGPLAGMKPSQQQGQIDVTAHSSPQESPLQSAASPSTSSMGSSTSSPLSRAFGVGVVGRDKEEKEEDEEEEPPGWWAGLWSYWGAWGWASREGPAAAAVAGRESFETGTTGGSRSSSRSRV